MKHTGITIFLVLLLQACGFAHVRTNVPSSGLDSYSYATVGKINVTSIEQNADLQNLNRELETDVASEVDALLSRTGLRRATAEGPSARALSFNVDVDIEYGNRGLRYLSGGIGGAGRGRVKTVLRVTDLETGETRYQSVSESNLSLGLFGGSMRSTIKENIKKLMDHYPN